MFGIERVISMSHDVRYTEDNDAAVRVVLTNHAEHPIGEADSSTWPTIANERDPENPCTTSGIGPSFSLYFRVVL